MMCVSSTTGILVLSSSDIDHIISTLSPTELMNLMEKAFVLSSLSGLTGEGVVNAYAPHRTSIPSKNHTVLFMPARIAVSDKSMLEGMAVKVVSVPLADEGPKSKDVGTIGARGLPATTLVLDEDTGSVKAVVNARKLTALRTGAGSLLSTTLVGPQNPTSIVAFGAGKQIQAHLLLHLQYYPSIRKCTIINRSSSSPNVQNLRNVVELQFKLVQFNYLAYSASSPSSTKDGDNVRKVLEDASIIVCATSSERPLFPSSWVREGTHVILVGSFKPEMREVDRELILRAVPSGTTSEFGHGKVTGNMKGLLLVDSYSACQVEAGEIIDAHLGRNDMVEIGELCSHQASMISRNTGQEKEQGVGQDSMKGAITLFKSVGLGVQDVAIACAVVKRAEEMGIGTYIEDYDI